MMSMRRVMAELRARGLPLNEVQQQMKSMKESVSSPITQADFLDALKKVNPSVGKGDLDRFQKWMDEFGSA